MSDTMTDQERKKAAAAIFTAAAEGKAIEERYGQEPFWRPCDPFVTTEYPRVFSYPDCYRIAPEPVTRPWSNEDVPPLCWLRQITDPTNQSLVIGVSDDGAEYINDLGENTQDTWAELLAYSEYSTDRRTWHPCTVTTP